MYPTCVSSKLCEFIFWGMNVFIQLFDFLGIILGFSSLQLFVFFLGHYLRHVWGVIWDIIWGMSGASWGIIMGMSGLVWDINGATCIYDTDMDESLVNLEPWFVCCKDVVVVMVIPFIIGF